MVDSPTDTQRHPLLSRAACTEIRTDITYRHTLAWAAEAWHALWVIRAAMLS